MRILLAVLGLIGIFLTSIPGAYILPRHRREAGGGMRDPETEASPATINHMRGE
jgi:hypothetical protein